MGHLHGVGGAAQMNRKAAATSAVLCLLFLVVYGSCNWLTALRAGVGSFYFGWERHIPFVPLMIVPYMSIDLFFIAAPFMCVDDRRHRAIAARLIASIMVGALFFVLFPLRFAFERPAADGWLGTAFNIFRMLDKPYNQFPSLHITLGVILLELYARRTRGVLRVAICVWFALIGLSAVLTYQHHVIDVVGGLGLAVLCFYLFGESQYGCRWSVIDESGCIISRARWHWRGSDLSAARGAFYRCGPRCRCVWQRRDTSDWERESSARMGAGSRSAVG